MAVAAGSATVAYCGERGPVARGSKGLAQAPRRDQQGQRNPAILVTPTVPHPVLNLSYNHEPGTSYREWNERRGHLARGAKGDGETRDWDTGRVDGNAARAA